MIKFLSIIRKNFATKIQGGTSKNNKSNAGKRLGVKKFHGQEVFPNDILVRQRGLRWKPGINVFVGKDHTLHSKVEGSVIFNKKFKENGKKQITVGVQEKEIPNRKIKFPDPYCYHPEQFPELAKNNPEPLNLYKNKLKEKEKTNVYDNYMWFKFEENYYKKPTYEKINENLNLNNIEIPEGFNNLENTIVERSEIISNYIEKINEKIEKEIK